MNGRLKLSLLATLFCLLVFGLVLVEQHESEFLRRQEQETQEEEQGREMLETLCTAAAPSLQIRRILVAFAQQAALAWPTKGPGDPATFVQWARATHAKMGLDQLPAHDMVWVATCEARIPSGLRACQIASAGFGCDEEVATRFVGNVLQIKGFHDNDQAALWTRMSRILHFPFLERQDQDQDGKLQVFTSFAGRRGLFWTRVNRQFLMVILAMDELSPEQGMQLLTRESGHPFATFGFFARDGRQRILSPALANRRDLILWGSGLALSQESQPQPRFGMHCHVGKVQIGSDWVAVVFRPAPTLAVPWFPLGNASFRLACTVFLISIVGMWLLIYRLNRSATVGSLLLGACLCVTLLPVSGLHSLVRRAVREYGLTLFQAVDGELERNIRRFDSSPLFIHASVRDEILRQLEDPSLERRLLQTTTDLGRRKVLKELIEETVARPPYPTEKGGETYVLIGPDGFAESWRAGLEPDEKKADDRKPLAKQLGPLNEISLDLNRSGSGVALGRAGSGASLRKGYESDTFMEILSQLMGRDVLVGLLYFPGQVVDITSNSLHVFLMMAGFPEPPRFMSQWSWNDSIELDYINLFVASQPSQTPRAMLPPVPARAFPRLHRLTSAVQSAIQGWHIIQRQDYSKWLRETAELAGIPAVKAAAMQAQTSGFPRTILDRQHPEQPLIKAMPGRNFSRFVLTHFQGTAWIDKRLEVLRLVVMLLSFSALLIAILAARYAQRRVVLPLQKLQQAIGRIQEHDYRVRLDDTRADEFGTLANAFNRMAKALEEAEVLHAYVSGSIQKVIQDPEFRERARQGMNRRVSVIFSTLRGFSAFQAVADQTALFEAMSRHLELFHEAVGRCGGEIDKVIGEKVMVVFDHDILGGDAPTGQAIEQTISYVQARFSHPSLSLAIGVSSGTAIAGILGSRHVKQDYTVIGDVVNLAARLAAVAYEFPEGGAVVSGHLLPLLPSAGLAKKLPVTQVKGKQRSVEAFQLPHRGAG